MKNNYSIKNINLSFFLFLFVVGGFVLTGKAQFKFTPIFKDCTNGRDCYPSRALGQGMLSWGNLHAQYPFDSEIQADRALPIATISNFPEDLASGEKGFRRVLFIKKNANDGEKVSFTLAPEPGVWTTSNTMGHFSLVEAEMARDGKFEYDMSNTWIYGKPKDYPDVRFFNRLVAKDIEDTNWPLLFIKYYKKDGAKVTECQEMLNLEKETTFEVTLYNNYDSVEVVGDEGIWKVVATSQNLDAVDVTKANRLRYLNLRDNKLADADKNSTITLPTTSKLETFIVDKNGIKDLKLTNAVETSLKYLSAKENLLEASPFSANTPVKLHYLDLSMNLIKDWTKNTNNTEWFDNKEWFQFVGGNYTVSFPYYSIDLKEAGEKIFTENDYAVEGESGSLVSKYIQDSYQSRIVNEDCYKAIDKNLLKLFNVWGANGEMGTATQMVNNDASNGATPDPVGITITAKQNELNLTVNKMNVATLPQKPSNLQNDKYHYELQERYIIPATEKTVGTRKEYTLAIGEELDLSSQMRALGIHNTEQFSEITFYREMDAGTDHYVPISSDDYRQKELGKYVFRRTFALENKKVFAEIKTNAYPSMASFERVVPATANYTTGLSHIVEQPAGTTETINANYLQDLTNNKISDRYKSETSTAALGKAIFRTNSFLLTWTPDKNYWLGRKDNNWNDTANWACRYIPTAVEGQLTSSLTEEQQRNHNITFATVDNYGDVAYRDLHTGELTRNIYDLTNHSENGRALVVNPAGNLTIQGTVDIQKATKGIYKNEEDLSYRLLVKELKGKPAGSLILYNPDQKDNKKVKATLEFLARTDNANLPLYNVNWQYFGVPLKGVTKAQLPATTWVRKYNNLKNDNLDEKWEDVAQGETLEVGKGYEIAQNTASTYRFKGEVNTGNYTWTINQPVANVPWSEYTVCANPYTASIDIKKLQLNDLERTLWIYNDGSREIYFKNFVSKVLELPSATAYKPFNQAGEYYPIPIDFVGDIASKKEWVVDNTGWKQQTTAQKIPSQIPSQQAFLVKCSTVGNNPTMTYSYQENRTDGTTLVNLLPNTGETYTDQFNKAEKANPARTLSSLVALTVSSDNSSDLLLLSAVQGTTKNYDDGYDGEKIFSANKAQLYALQDRNYQIATADNLDQTPIAFVAGDRATKYTLHFNAKHFDSPDLQYYLVDHKVGKTIPLHQGETYEFQATANDPIHRFTLRSSTVTDIEQAIQTIDVKALGNDVVVSNHTDKEASVKIYDMKGVCIAQFVVKASKENKYAINLPGVYVVKVSNGEVNKTHRFLFN